MDKGRADYLEVGDWNVSCHECGRKRKASTMVRHWQGYYICPTHNEPRHPQDFVRNVQDIQTPAWAQPRPEPTYIDRILLGACTYNGISAVPDQAIPGCMIPDYLSDDYEEGSI